MISPSAEGALPEGVAEDHHRRLSRHVVLGLQQASVHGPRAQHRKQAGRGLEPFDALRLIRAEQRGDAPARDRHLLERAVLLLDVEVLPWRRPVLRDVDARRPQPQHDEPIRIGVGQRLQQQRVDDAEDRAVGADADRQRRDDDQRQRPAAAQRPDGIAEILQHLAHRATIHWAV
jgi:hypothetical protein